ncbi:Cardiolipin synthetase [hydrothermal vent metagenome]|uniref:Cardiolipin synthetase n=1 Tax=hydrothermal vent metagenome TaxID=652676 RepID=A0A3B1BII0_9ZZZZ
MGIPNFAIFIFLALTLLIFTALIQFIFNPLGLGPEPDSVLKESFFTTPATSLSDLTLLIDGHEAFDSALAAIGRADKTVFVQTFIWKDDGIGKKIVNALISAADRGVKVSVKKDALGTFFELGDILKGRPSPVFANSGFKKHKNISVKVDPLSANDHSKYFIIDSDTVLFGGMNIADEYHNEWHDYMVMLKSRRWAPAFADKVLRSAPWPEGAPYVLATNDRRATEIRTAILQIIDHARQRIILEHAYFSDSKVIAAIIRAAQRGVQVDIVLPKNPGTHLYANMATINRLLESGRTGKLNVYIFPKMTHAKVALVDGTIAAVGSANLTPRSMMTTREATVFVHGANDDPFIKRLRGQLQADIALSERVAGPFKLTIKERLGAVAGKYIW